MDRNVKIAIIADTQQKLNKRMKKWCEAESAFIEKRSFVHNYNDIFVDKNNRQFKIEKTILKMSLSTNSSANVDEAMRHIETQYSLYAKSIDKKDELYASYQPIKFIFYGLHYIDEDIVELQYGLSDILGEATNIKYI